MGVYGIYIMVLTLVILVYYMIVIGMDLYNSSKKGKSSSSELIKVEGAEEIEDSEEEEPTHIEGIDIFGEKSASRDNDVKEEERPMSAEEIVAMQTDIMYEESKKARQKMEPINPKAQNEFSLTTDKDALLDFYNLDQLAGAGNFHNEEDGYE